MAKKTYWEKLKDPRWQKKRLEALQKASFACEVCYDDESTLHVHHKQYFKGREPWDYDLAQLAVLCENCHSETHGTDDELSVACSFLPMDGPRSRSSVASLIAGFARMDRPDASLDPFAYYSGVLADNVMSFYTNIHDYVDLAEWSEHDGRGMFDAMLAYVREAKGRNA